MNITDWTNKEIIKLLLARKRVTQKDLLGKISAPIQQTTFSGKLSRNSLKVAELQAICDVLGYNLVLEEKQ